MSPLRILYQDEFLVAIDKPAGMIVHPGRDPEPPANIAMKCLRDQLGCRVFPIHRLDRPTSGVLLFALDKKTAALAQQAFEKRNVVKTYFAIVSGKTPARWICETPLENNPGDESLSAQTHFERLAITATRSLPDKPELSLIKATPETGRFHQIRRHLLESGHPVVGDFRYAGMDRSFELCGILDIGTRMLLQSAVIRLDHPHSGIPLNIEAPPDSDFEKVFPDIAAITGHHA